MKFPDPATPSWRWTADEHAAVMAQRFEQAHADELAAIFAPAIITGFTALLRESRGDCDCECDS
jgi:hypothetical protein